MACARDVHSRGKSTTACWVRNQRSFWLHADSTALVATITAARSNVSQSAVKRAQQQQRQAATVSGQAGGKGGGGGGAVEDGEGVEVPDRGVLEGQLRQIRETRRRRQRCVRRGNTAFHTPPPPQSQQGPNLA